MPPITTLAGGAIQIGGPRAGTAASRRRALLQSGGAPAPAPAAAVVQLPLQPMQIKARHIVSPAGWLRPQLVHWGQSL